MMKTKDKKTPGARNGAPRTLKVMPAKTGKKSPDELPSDIGSHEAIVRIPLEQIEFSPFNKRGSLKKQNLEELAASIKKVDVIQAIVVRKIAEDKYQLVFGERRYRAAGIAGLVDIPAVIRVYTDEQIIEVQWAENFQREDPHFMDEAAQIKEWMFFRKPEEIAIRMGRTLRYIRDRITLQYLIPDIEPLALADKFTLTECLEIAALSPISQEDFYDKYCKVRKDDDNFYIDNLDAVLESYRRKLANAPFDIKDASLVPTVGACITCPLNTACVSLFPADEADATCTDRACYMKKAEAQYWKDYQQAILDNAVTAYLQFADELTDKDRDALLNVPDEVTLAIIRDRDVTRVRVPEMPDKEDYVMEDEEDDWKSESGEETDEDEEGDGEPENHIGSILTEENNETTFTDAVDRITTGNADTAPERKEAVQPLIDEEAFNEAMAEFQDEQERYNELIQGHEVKSGIHVNVYGQIRIYTYIDVPPIHRTDDNGYSKKYTSKEVMAAIKDNKATVEMVQSEKKRIETWLAGKEAEDRTVVQEAIHATFGEFLKIDPVSRALSALDQSALYWYAFRSLDCGEQLALQEILFPGIDFDKEHATLEDFAGLDEGKKALLIHVSVFELGDAGKPGTDSAAVLKRLASQHINVQEIQSGQDAIAEVRRAKRVPIIASLTNKLAELDPTRPKDIPDWATALAVEDCQSLGEFIQKYRQPDLSLAPNEGADERALYTASEELKKMGYVTIYSKDSTTQKMVTFIPKPASEPAMLPDPAA